jgi:hypothetical protein
MATPSYFKNFKNIEYAVSSNKSGQVNYINIKDFFKLTVLKRGVFEESTLYYTYNVTSGERPDQIAKQEYGDEQFYWIVLQVNGIVNYSQQWPMSDQDLYNYTTKKYGGVSGSEQVHHYETVETFDAEGNLMLDAGLVVPEDFIFYYPDNAGSDAPVTLSSRPVPVSNRVYEERLNSEKSQITLLNSKYINDYVKEMKQYAKESVAQKSEVNISELM